jgi:hypothetical protein
MRAPESNTLRSTADHQKGTISEYTFGVPRSSLGFCTIVAGLGLLASSCAGHAETGDHQNKFVEAASLVGEWCGTPGDPSCSGDEALWLELRMQNGHLDGRMCENPNRDCNPLDEISLNGNEFKFAYTFGSVVSSPAPPVGGDAGPPMLQPGYRVEGTFTVSGETMTGQVWSSKCACSMSRTFVRL